MINSTMVFLYIWYKPNDNILKLIIRNMCLITKQIEPIVATEDITCYKVLNLLNKGEYFTPYRSTFVPSEIIVGEKALKPELKEGETFFDKRLQIDGKCIHSYATEEESLKQISDFREVFECIIPKGALYYKGDSNDYASSEIRFVKKIAEHKVVNRVLPLILLEDIGNLDWDLYKDNIINAFSEYGFLYDDKCVEEEVELVEVDVEPCEEEYGDEDEIVDVSKKEYEVQMEELEKKKEALSYRLYLAIKYVEENGIENGKIMILLPIVCRIFNQNPEVIIDIKQALDLYDFYFDIIKPLQRTCGIDTEASAITIVEQKLMGKETAIVNYIKGVIETCNTVLSKITE